MSASTTDSDDVRHRRRDQQPRDRPLAGARDQVLRQHPIGWCTSSTNASTRAPAPLRVPVPDPGVDQVRGIKSSGKASTSAAAVPPRRPDSSSRRCRAARPRPRTRRRPGRAGVTTLAEPERELEELRGDRVDRRRGRAEHDPDDDHVRREDDLVRHVDEEVAPADAVRSRSPRARDVRALQPQLAAARGAARRAGGRGAAA